MEKKYNLSDFDFNLPDDLIAQKPTLKRDESRLFVVNRKNDSFIHEKFHNIIDYINEDDVLVFNNARVIPARMFFKRESGGLVEVVLARRLGELNWLVITNRTKKLKNGEVLTSVVDDSSKFKVLGRDDEYLKIETLIEFTDELLDEIGKMPLPPYIKREATEFDKERYQTVYASESGAVAAPTAGLHFTGELLDSLKIKGIGIEFLTLYVSWGTFQPVRDNDLSMHKMHTESYFLSESAADNINRARKEGRRIIAVGTTSLRVLESTYCDGRNIPGFGETDIFIYPPNKIKSIDCLITNFHTPYSTLLMLVSAFAGYDKIMSAYKEAVNMKYRFFSYGDAMLIV